MSTNQIVYLKQIQQGKRILEEYSINIISFQYQVHSCNLILTMQENMVKTWLLIVTLLSPFRVPEVFVINHLTSFLIYSP